MQNKIEKCFFLSHQRNQFIDFDKLFFFFGSLVMFSWFRKTLARPLLGSRLLLVWWRSVLNSFEKGSLLHNFFLFNKKMIKTPKKEIIWPIVTVFILPIYNLPQHRIFFHATLSFTFSFFKPLDCQPLSLL
jgi:hypothetical protein